MGRPIRTNRRCESGILTAGCQTQPGVDETLDVSSPPTQRAKCPRCAKAPFAQWRIAGNPPTARAVTISAKSTGVRISLKRSGITSTFSIFSDLTTSDKKAHFFLFDSISLIWSVGATIFRANPGNPAPEPKSAIRQFFTGIRQLMNIDSPKCPSTVSTGSTIEVKLTD